MRKDAVTFGRRRVCWDCKELLSLNKYSPVKDKPGERHYVCKGCCNVRAKAWYAKNREKGKARRLAWVASLRDRAIRSLGGPECRCCGEHRRSMLDINHVNNDGARHRRERSTIGQLRDVIANPGPYQVLCCNCNHSKRRNGGRCEHKTEFMQTLHSCSIEVNP